MAGSILGQDQVDKVNALYGRVHAHIQSLLKGAPSPIDLMRVHVLTEHLDTTELSRIFMELPFLSPAEKRALVRTAIFDVLITGKVTASVVVPADANVNLDSLKEPGQIVVEAVPKTFTPPQFNLNVATTKDHQVK